MKSLLDDTELVEKLQKGDVEAFDLLYEKYSGKIYAFGFRYLKSKAEAEELVQSVFLKLWEYKKNLKKELFFKSFLFTIAYNDICKIFRKRKYLQTFISDALADNPHFSLEIEEGIGYQSVLERIQKIILKLPERQKTIFLKSRDEGKTTKEIATELGLSAGTVDNYISKTLKFIRHRLKNEDYAIFLFFPLFF